MPGQSWSAFLVGQCGLQQSRANELITLAVGRTTLAKLRAGTRDRLAAHRARTKRPLRNGGLATLDEAWRKASGVDRTNFVFDHRAELERMILRAGGFDGPAGMPTRRALQEAGVRG
jgi:hypothetical protein